MHAAERREIERLSVARLGLLTGDVGERGSPTIVVGLVNEEPTRAPIVFADGSVLDRVTAACARLARLLDVRAPRESPLPPLPQELRDDREVAVLLTDSTGRLDPRSLPILSEVRRSLPGFWPSAIVVGDRPNRGELEEIARAGPRCVYYAPATPPIDSSNGAAALGALVARRPRLSALLALAEPYPKASVAMLAARGRLGLTADVVSLRHDPEMGLVMGKPAFGGGIIAGIRSRTTPYIATVRPGTFELGPPEERTDGTPTWEEVPFAPVPVGVELVDRGFDVDRSWGDLLRAPVAVVIGMGVGGVDPVKRIRSVVSPLGAALGATRRVVDDGWVPRQLQVGLTGRSIAPSLAILVGVSGSANHMTGLRRARAILAINSDPKAPVFLGADVGIVGAWEEVLPLLVPALAQLLPPPPMDPE